MDADHNGTIEKSEFLAACEKMKVSGVDSETVNKIYGKVHGQRILPAALPGVPTCILP